MKSRITSPSTSRLDSLSRGDRQRPRLKITCCYVPETHDPAGGILLTIGEVVKALLDPVGDPRDGIMVLGGEPFFQPAGLAILLRKLQGRSLHTVVYSGYTLEVLARRSEPEVLEALHLIDLLVDGPFVAALTEGAGEWRGSRNQRLIHRPAGILNARNQSIE